MGAHQVNDPRKGISLCHQKLRFYYLIDLSEIGEENRITVITAGNKDLDSEISFNSIHFGIVIFRNISKTILFL